MHEIQSSFFRRKTTLLWVSAIIAFDFTGVVRLVANHKVAESWLISHKTRQAVFKFPTLAAEWWRLLRNALTRPYSTRGYFSSALSEKKPEKTLALLSLSSLTLVYLPHRLVHGSLIITTREKSASKSLFIVKNNFRTETSEWTTISTVASAVTPSFQRKQEFKIILFKRLQMSTLICTD